MVARGRFGGNVFKDLLTIRISVPTRIRLDFNFARVHDFVGKRAAKQIKGRLEGGTDGDGRPLHLPQDGTPMRDSGRLLGGMRYDKATSQVAPEFRRRHPDASRRARTAFGVMSIHIARGLWRDPMGFNNEGEWRQRGKWMEEALARELRSGRGGLVAHIRTIERRL